MLLGLHHRDKLMYMPSRLLKPGLLDCCAGYWPCCRPSRGRKDGARELVRQGECRDTCSLRNTENEPCRHIIVMVCMAIVEGYHVLIFTRSSAFPPSVRATARVWA